MIFQTPFNSIRQGLKNDSKIKNSKQNGAAYHTGLALLITAGILSGCRLSGGADEIRIADPAVPASTSVKSVPEGEISLQPDSSPGAKATSGKVPRASFIVCEIKGHIQLPGVYDMAEGSRVGDLIGRSGGILETGSLEWVNQARKLSDGEVIIIPSKGITKEQYQALAIASPTPPAIENTGSSGEKGPLVNINTANETELDSIPGIGPATAKNIIDYRRGNGPFSRIEDLKKVDRIGDKTFEKLKVYITVGN